MQVNSINSVSNQAFCGAKEDLETIINYTDSDVRQLAYINTRNSVNTKRYKRQKTVLDMALPLAGGLSAAALADKGARLNAFGKGTAAWGLFLLGIGAVFGAEKVLRNHSEKFNNFVEKHPILTFATSLAGAYFAGKYTIKGGAKLGKLIKNTNLYKGGMEKAGKLAENLKKTAFVHNMSDKISNLKQKTPQAIKDVAKGVASWAPLAVIIGQLAHSANYTNSVNKKYNDNYNNLKEAQINLARQYNEHLKEELENA